MATQKQLIALRKARAAKKRSTKGFRGIGGFTMPNTKTLLDAFKKSGLMVIGFVGGREVSRKLIKDDAEGFKRYLGSVIQLGGGVLLCTQKNEALRYVGYGLTASGAIEAVSKVLNKDILAEGVLAGFNLGNILTGKSLPNVDVTKIKLPFDYMPDLPEIVEQPKTEDVEYQDVTNEEFI